VIDTAALEELNPCNRFNTASLQTARVVNLQQASPTLNTAKWPAIQTG
jgi:hypothetical protein